MEFLEEVKTFSKHHGASQVLDGFFNDVGKHEHHGLGLLFREAFILEALHKFQGIEVVVAGEGWGRGEALCVIAYQVGVCHEGSSRGIGHARRLYVWVVFAFPWCG